MCCKWSISWLNDWIVDHCVFVIVQSLRFLFVILPLARVLRFSPLRRQQWITGGSPVMCDSAGRLWPFCGSKEWVSHQSVAGLFKAGNNINHIIKTLYSPNSSEAFWANILKTCVPFTKTTARQCSSARSKSMFCVSVMREFFLFRSYVFIVAGHMN